MNCSQKEKTITGLVKEKVRRLRNVVSSSILRMKPVADTENKKDHPSKAEFERQKAINMELNEQEEENIKAIETMKHQFALLKNLDWSCQQEATSSNDDRVYSQLGGVRLAESENEAFMLHKKIEILKDEFDAVDAIQSEKEAALLENTSLKQTVTSLNAQVNDQLEENEMLNGELGEAECTIQQLQSRIAELEKVSQLGGPSTSKSENFTIPTIQKSAEIVEKDAEFTEQFS